jgi:hypothetical protein
MAQVQSIDLSSKLKQPGELTFLSAEWWSKSSRFVLVRYSYKDEEQKFGLRLDLDKRIFLDHLDDPKLDEFVQRFYARIIWQIVADARSSAGVL